MADGDFPMLLGMIARCGSTIDVRVSARSNIFGAGIAERPDPAGGGGGVSPSACRSRGASRPWILETVRGGVSFSSHPGFSDGAQGSFSTGVRSAPTRRSGS